uniref:Uncharacterized protein n=1 Tax=Timema poppense TaxID=170557 RepID=A0A7R9GV45_TIMPO|nr:unnamed protein product [Timema poppensis]
MNGHMTVLTSQTSSTTTATPRRCMSLVKIIVLSSGALLEVLEVIGLVRPGIVTAVWSPEFGVFSAVGYTTPGSDPDIPVRGRLIEHEITALDHAETEVKSGVIPGLGL